MKENWYGLAIRKKDGTIDSIGAHRYTCVAEAVADVARVAKIRAKDGHTEPIVAVVGQCRNGEMPIARWLALEEQK